jgi:hypothetical protein
MDRSDDARSTTFVHSGDPVAGTGWIAPLDAELRMMSVAGRSPSRRATRSR